MNKLRQQVAQVAHKSGAVYSKVTAPSTEHTMFHTTRVTSKCMPDHCDQ